MALVPNRAPDYKSDGRGDFIPNRAKLQIGHNIYNKWIFGFLCLSWFFGRIIPFLRKIRPKMLKFRYRKHIVQTPRQKQKTEYVPIRIFWICPNSDFANASTNIVQQVHLANHQICKFFRYTKVASFWIPPTLDFGHWTLDFGLWTLNPLLFYSSAPVPASIGGNTQIWLAHSFSDLVILLNIPC